MPHCEAPVIDGRCPFDRAALPEPGPTPATHFALSTAPDAATALLLPFAEHPWHSRVVAALREDAALSTAADDGAEFVLVALPERLRPSVRAALAELLDLRAHDRRAHCGLSCVYPSEYSGVLTSTFPPSTHEVTNVTASDGTVTDDDPYDTNIEDDSSHTSSDAESDEESAPSDSEQTAAAVPIETEQSTVGDVAAVCQLCRAGEFLQCSTITDLACEWLGSWLENVAKMEQRPDLSRLALQSLCDGDMGQPFRSVAEKLDPTSFTFARHPELDPTFLSAMQSTECSFGLLGRIARAVPDVVLDYIPPCALPHRVVETQLPCWLKTEDYCSVYHKRHYPLHTSSSKYILYVGKTTRAQDCKRATLYFSTWDLLRPFLPFKADGIVLPPGIPDYAPVFGSALFSSATSITFPNDFRDEHWGSFAKTSCEKVEQLDFSQTQISAIPSACCRWLELERAFLPPTLETIHDGAFSCCPKLREVTGLHRSVTVHPTAFAFTYSLPVSTFKHLPEAPGSAIASQSAREKRPRND